MLPAQARHRPNDHRGKKFPTSPSSLASQPGPIFSGQFEIASGLSYSPCFGFDAIFNFGGSTEGDIPGPTKLAASGWRGRVQAGVDLAATGGTRIAFGGSYDGIGQDDVQLRGLQFDVTIPWQRSPRVA